jgi:hypothetical protein
MWKATPKLQHWRLNRKRSAQEEHAQHHAGDGEHAIGKCGESIERVKITAAASSPRVLETRSPPESRSSPHFTNFI